MLFMIISLQFLSLIVSFFFLYPSYPFTYPRAMKRPLTYLGQHQSFPMLSNESEDNRAANGGNERKQILVLGVCGGIASGKSKACQILSSNPDFHKCVHIDVDKLAHSLYDSDYPESQKLLTEIRAEFGEDVVRTKELGNTEVLLELDRKALGNIVFADPSRMSALERIVWPRLKIKLLEQLKQLEQKIESSSGLLPVVAVVEAAMLLEADWDDILDAVWVVRSPNQHQHERLVQHRNLHPDEALLKIQAQSHRRGIGNVDQEKQKGLVTAVIDNDGCLDTLTKKLAQAWNDPNSWRKTQTESD